jgi:hypothetical protein
LIERNIKRATDKSQADYTEARPLPQRVWHSAGDDDVAMTAHRLAQRVVSDALLSLGYV